MYTPKEMGFATTWKQYRFPDDFNIFIPLSDQKSIENKKKFFKNRRLTLFRFMRLRILYFVLVYKDNILKKKENRDICLVYVRAVEKPLFRVTVAYTR